MQLTTPQMDTAWFNGLVPPTRQPQEPTNVEDCEQEPPAGELECQGIHWHQAPGTSRWHTPPVIVTDADKVTFRVKCVVQADVKVEDQDDGVKQPPGLEARLWKRATVSQAKHVRLESHELTQ